MIDPSTGIDHVIKVRADSGSFYAICSCNEWRTEADYFTRREALSVGRDHLCALGE